MDSVARRRSPCRKLAPWGAFGLWVGALLAPSLVATEASADQLDGEVQDGEAGYSPVEELSYEAIIEPSRGYDAILRIRLALRNGSLTPRDAVHTLALPFAAQLEGLNVAYDGQWNAGHATQIVAEGDRRDPGTVFARALPPASPTDVPAAEIVAFGVGPGATVQIELLVRVYPRLHGDRWELDLPARTSESPTLASERRVLVTGQAAQEAFFVDDRDNAGRPFIVSSPANMVTVAWPAHIRHRGGALEGHLETIPSSTATSSGEFRLFLRLGHAAAPRPDHVVFVIDQSRSTPERMQQDVLSVAKHLLASVDPATTFDVLAFDRHVETLLDPALPPPRADDVASLERVRATLSSRDRGQGTDLGTALREAARRVKARQAKRPLIVTFTDGMFPASLDAKTLESELSAIVGRKPPELLFVVDEPMLASSGIEIGHPVARLAAKLGARLSLKTLSQLDAEASRELLRSPRVLGDLDVGLSAQSTWIDPVPAGLVAGNFVLLRGRYDGRRPRKFSVRGTMGGRPISAQVLASVRAPTPSALVASLGDPSHAIAEGFTRPPWYRPRQSQDARRAITQAGRAGDRRKGYLDEKIFRHYLTTRVLPRARACYNRGLTRHRDQSGRVVLRIEVGKGEVMAAEVSDSALEHPDAQLLHCLNEAAWALDVPAGKLDGRIYELRYPLRLVAPPEGATEGAVERISDAVMQELLRSG